jgi:type 1 fimbria pilin
MEQKRRHFVFRTAARGLVLVLMSVPAGLVAVPAQAATASVDVPVTQTVLPANCDLALDNGDMNGGVVDFGTLRSEDLKGAGRVSAAKWFNVTLSNCGAAGSYTPTVTVRGTSQGAGSNAYLFRDAASTSAGLGFIFHFNGKSVTWTSGAGEKNIKPDDEITDKSSGAVLPPGWDTDPIPVAVAVSTGDNTAQMAGSLTAAVTFTFEYK